MSEQLGQCNFVVSNLFIGNVELPEQIWIEAGEILLKPQGKIILACVLARGHDDYQSMDKARRKLIAYLQTCSLFSSQVPQIEGGNWIPLRDISELGNNDRVLITRGSIDYPPAAKQEFLKHFPTFLKETISIHDKYRKMREEYIFLDIATGCFFASRNHSVFANQGFLNAMMTLEALFNEGDGDIAYKLASRTSLLLEFIGLNSIDVFHDLKKLYRIRNDMVHANKEIHLTNEPVHLEKYAVNCLKIMYLLCMNHQDRIRTIGKDKRKRFILQKIDNAMINDTAKQLLTIEVKDGLKAFELTVPKIFEGDGFRFHR